MKHIQIWKWNDAPKELRIASGLQDLCGSYIAKVPSSLLEESLITNYFHAKGIPYADGLCSGELRVSLS